VIRAGDGGGAGDCVFSRVCAHAAHARGPRGQPPGGGLGGISESGAPRVHPLVWAHPQSGYFPHVSWDLGIAVDYSAFIAYSFLTHPGTRKERAAKALDHRGEAAFNGGLTMFVAVVLVCFARSYAFQTFFKMFSLTVLLGLWHGLVALPAALALVGSRPYSSCVVQESSTLKEHASKEGILRGWLVLMAHDKRLNDA